MIEVTQEDREAAEAARAWCDDMNGPEMVEAFARHRIASIAAARPMIAAEERERCARVADQWRDENKAAAAKARKRSRAMSGTPFEDPSMAEMLDGAAIECNAIAAAIRAMGVETP